MGKEFFRNENGATIVEYSLILAMISIGLVNALQPQVIGTSFVNFITRFITCLTGACI